jgi:hypothetical protein
MKRSPKMRASRRSRRQSGAVLIISIVMLIVVALLALSGARTSVVELRTSGNMLSRNVAFSIAEVGLSVGEQRIETDFPSAPTTDFSIVTTDGLYYDGDITDIRSIWSGLNGYESGVDGVTFVIEYLGPFAAPGSSLSVGAGVATNVRYLYRVSSHGSGFRGSTHLLQSIYAVAP